LPLSSPLGMFALASCALVINLFFLANYTALTRARQKIFLNKEDAGKGATVGDAEHPSVTRLHRAHRNAIENLLPFFVIGGLYVASGASQRGAMAYFATFTVARWLHSFFYLAGIQPWRTIAFVVGTLAILGMLVHLVITVFSGA
jgi:glutathione S-transferase